MKLLVDMNLSPRWVTVLRAGGIETTHWAAIGKATADDREIMVAARAGDFVVLTHNLDFGLILATSRAVKPSVVQLRSDDVSPDVAAPALIEALRACEADLAAGALLTVDAARYRVTILPLGR